ncbi:TRAP transporter small permease [Photobacterium sp. ZSDE20]|uniref:TRAP transporter small permease protein n=1 Tax=Photobacterium pectinilyticum TaxID=2906793 RepID=A0ABT1N2A8_9GAMM|nr:TRAP transporter small permease [Photobacterium sp. ZSDE20]MCQ1058667.1 TRAP transporter small permease [Photobacterium sp. ZSDE20]MDD1823381.1 TRAP transporter small permease [Photobacterium sp. ZSDE20]
MLKKKLLTSFRSFFITISTLSIIVNVATLLYGVFSRYFLGASPIWVDELSRYLMISASMLIAGVVMLSGEHMRLNVVDKLPFKKIKLAISIYTYSISICICLFMAYFSYRYAISIHSFTTIGLDISKTIPMLALPIGFTCLLFCTFIRLTEVLIAAKETV